MAWQISFTYLHDHDAVLASFIGVELATLADVVRWVREVDIRMGTFGRKFDLLIDLTGLVVKPSAAAEFGRRRAEVLSKHTLSSFRFGGDRPTVTSVYTSSVLYKAAANHHATLDDAILALKKDRESRISRPR